MARTGLQRLEAITGAIERGEEFQRRVVDAEGDAVRCADLMAEAIAMARESRGHEPIGRDGKATVCVEEIKAAHCMDAAAAAYLKARGSNRPAHTQRPGR
jgi:hypothetical protein